MDNAPMLKPCPFCAASARVSESWGWFHIVSVHEVGCFFPTRQSHSFGSQAGAIKAWDTRIEVQP